MTDHIHDCDGSGCNGYTVCQERECREPQQAPCWTCSQDRIRHLDARLQGQGTGLTALAVHPSSLTDVVTLFEDERNKLRRTVLAVAAVYHRYAQGDQSGGAAVDAMERIGAVLRKP